MIFPDQTLLNQLFDLFYQYYYKFIFNSQQTYQLHQVNYKNIIIYYLIDLNNQSTSNCSGIHTYNDKKYITLNLTSGEDHPYLTNQSACLQHPELFALNCQQIKNILSHEIIHVMQLTSNFGLPPKSCHNKQSTISTKNISTQDHALSDIEFYPNLFTIWSEYQSSNQPMKQFIQQHDLLNILHDHNPQKYKIAIKHLYKEYNEQFLR